MASPGDLHIDHAGRPADYAAWAAEVVRAGYTLDWRYLCWLDQPYHDDARRRLNASKIARPEEIRAAHAAGLDVGLVWQDTKGDALGGFPAGRRNGAEARRQAEALGAPAGTWIYFVVADHHARPEEHPTIAAYLQGVKQTIGQYVVAGYGKNTVGRAMLDQRLVAGWWQSYGFSVPVGHIEPWAKCYQRSGQVMVGGVKCDVNECFVHDLGEWRRPVMRVPKQLIADLRREGIDVPEHLSPWGLGSEIAFVKYLVWHHTATGVNWSDQGLRELLRKGRGKPGQKDYLPGPLAQWGLERDGQLPFIADGKANHNGYGDGGNNTWAIEAANTGVGEPYPNVQIDIWCRASAVMCLFMRTTPDKWIRAHKETDPGRKIDPAGINMDHMRQAVAAHMARMLGFPPQPPPPPPPPFSVVKSGLRLNALERTMARLAITTNLDDMGRGWLPLDGGAPERPLVPFGDLLSVRPMGSDPAREGYWPVPETGEQNKDGNTLLTIEGGPPGGAVTLYLVVPD